jgi:hypothetical protein
LKLDITSDLPAREEDAMLDSGDDEAGELSDSSSAQSWKTEGYDTDQGLEKLVYKLRKSLES